MKRFILILAAIWMGSCHLPDSKIAKIQFVSDSSYHEVEYVQGIDVPDTLIVQHNFLDTAYYEICTQCDFDRDSIIRTGSGSLDYTIYNRAVVTDIYYR